MPKYQVAFEKSYFYDVEVEAASEEDAEEKALEILNTEDAEQFYRAQSDIELCVGETEEIVEL